MNRIDKVFNKLKEENKKALIPFISNGDPSLEKTVKTILKLEIKYLKNWKTKSNKLYEKQNLRLLQQKCR